ncbi:MerR family transcriptional regulator [Corynebacterium glyciniphilum]|uniref:MerR family transcriptional regulator n=1 Tax=Corynebacterium glyciniphilum TaxID=1404244 RepID=UPI00265057C0|nr:MerR family transcriptional regulator [Corynebacterium glyciniphilum]MDN5683537.1 MerR family transcriptional regulator [Corynebacterium glyciniphilum]
MRISEVAEQTGIPPRLLRYYEEQGLLVPDRNSSGYRNYTVTDVEVARRVRQLLDAGLSTATIRTVLPCLTERAGRLAPICEETVADLRREQARIEESIDTLSASRDAIASVISADATVPAGQHPAAGRTPQSHR